MLLDHVRRPLSALNAERRGAEDALEVEVGEAADGGDHVGAVALAHLGGDLGALEQLKQ